MTDINETPTRVVKTYGRDLAIGDVIVKPDRATWEGVVYNVPQLNVPEPHMVSFLFYNGTEVIPRVVRDAYVMRVLQERRTS